MSRAPFEDESFGSLRAAPEDAVLHTMTSEQHFSLLVSLNNVHHRQLVAKSFDNMMSFYPASPISKKLPLFRPSSVRPSVRSALF